MTGKEIRFWYTCKVDNGCPSTLVSLMFQLFLSAVVGLSPRDENRFGGELRDCGVTNGIASVQPQ